MKKSKKNFKRVMGSLLATLLLAANLPAIYAVAVPQEEAELEIVNVEYAPQGEYGYIGYKYVTDDGKDYIPNDERLYCSSVNTALPESYDSRELGIITETKSQGVSGNCWAFSSISALETNSIKQGLTDAETTDFSEAHLSWFASNSLVTDESDPTHGDGLIFEKPYLRGGNWKLASAVFARHSGPANEADYPFYGTDFTKMGNYDESQRYDTGGGILLESTQVIQTHEEVKEWVMEHGSATVSYYYDDAYYHWNNTAYCCTTDDDPNHEVVIVGWDDNYPAENFDEDSRPEYDGAWICKNSWGEYWGMGGFFYLSYYDTTIETFAGYIARSAENIKNNYTYNGAEWRTQLNCNTAMEVANVFKAEGNEKLTSIATYTATPDVNLLVSVYCNLPEDYTKPTQGTKVAEISTTIHNTGYHTLYLDTPIDLDKDCIFSVVVRHSVSSGIVSVPFEMSGRSENAYTAIDGQSYINTNLSRPVWRNSSYHSVQNAYIQAITINGDCKHPELIPTVITASTCSTQGIIADVCADCGYVAAENALPYAEHNFGEWSEFTHDEVTNRQISYRECSACGNKSERSYVTGNTVAGNTFFESLIERILKMIMQILTGNIII